jgi:hypothetical protein
MVPQASANPNQRRQSATGPSTKKKMWGHGLILQKGPSKGAKAVSSSANRHFCVPKHKIFAKGPFFTPKRCGTFRGESALVGSNRPFGISFIQERMAMIRSKIAQLALAVALTAAGNSAIACSTLAWTNGATTTATAGEPGAGFARYSGRCALRASATGQFVQDDTPNAEPSYKARFYYTQGRTAEPTSVTSEVTLFQALQGTSTEVIKVSSTGSALKFFVNGTQVGAAAGVPVTAARYYSVEVRWANTGAFTAIVQGAAGAAQTVTGTGTAGGAIDTARLGVTAGTFTGAFYFDEFDSRRTQDVGRLCRGDANNSNTLTIADVVQTNNEAAGGNLALGQPDCNESASLTVGDVVCVQNLILAATTCN